MTTKAKALDRLIDAIAGENVPMSSQTVAGRLDTLADTLAGDDVTFSARDIAGRISQLAGMIEDGTISIGGGGDNWKPIGDGNTHLWVYSFGVGDTVSLRCSAVGTPGNITIDWGDGSVTQLTSTDETYYTHEYETKGVYVISFINETSSDHVKFGGGSTSRIFNQDVTSGTRLIYAECEDSAVWDTYALSGCPNLLQVSFNCAYVADYAIQNAYSLKNINISDKCTNFRGYCFTRASSLRNVTIPATITQLGASVFEYCFMLENVTVLASTPPTIAASTFNHCDNATFFVPAESVDAYKAATNWSSYASRIQAIPA